VGGNKARISTVRAMKVCGKLKVWFHSFLTMAVGGDEWSA